MTTLVLASTSTARAAMLAAAGVTFDVVPPQLDEDALKQGLAEAGAGPRAVAAALAEAKAVKVSRRFPQALVLGSDQVLVLDDGCLLDKPGSREMLTLQLQRLHGHAHRLVSSAVIAENGAAVWRASGTATLTMRRLSAAFIDDYAAHADPALLGSVGGYHIEAAGAQLFSRINGDHFTIRGLPLLAVLDYLRARGVLRT